MKTEMNLKKLIDTLAVVNNNLRNEAIKAVNIYLTLRNWYFGYYIYEFEQNGSDRAEYGKRVLSVISEKMKHRDISNADERELRRYRQLYLTYPQIYSVLISNNKIRGLPNPEFEIPVNHYVNLFQKVAYTHLSILIRVSENKRYFYESECLKCMWSVSELKRQIGSLLYERTVLSTDKAKLLKEEEIKSNKLQWTNTIKDPYIFEFIGLKSREIFTEKTLEHGLIDNLQNFILELGKGFCFEARQKRIIIDNEHYYIDLVFYHRILHCNVLIDLKTAKFHHSHASQLNMYVEYYKKYEMQKEDNPPIGILLCTDKDKEHVEFATAGIDKKLFVSTYLVSLPDIGELKDFMRKEMTMKEDVATCKKRIKGKF